MSSQYTARSTQLAGPELWCVRAGLVEYEPARAAQKRLEDARHGGEIPDTLLLLEHPPVYTKGRRSTKDELPMGEDWYRMQGIEVAETDRGGRVTYHGPGQLVAYPIVDLGAYGDDVHLYIRRMERVIIDSLAAHGVEAGPIEGLTGVWTIGDLPAGDRATPERVAEQVAGGEVRKIASIGVHVNRGITTHGLAINVNNDLQPFEWIVPCGIEGCRITSLCREAGGKRDMDAFIDTVCETFGRIYERRPLAMEAIELAATVDGLDALTANAGARPATLADTGVAVPLGR